MKRIFNIFLCTCIAIVAATSCQKSIDDERSATPKDNVDGQIEIRVGASLGEYSPVGATKAVLVNTLRASWDGGETIYVFDGERCLGTLNATLRDGHSEFAILSTDETHTVEKPADGTSVLTLVYSPALKEKPEVTDGALTVSLAKQDGSETPFVTYATLDYNGEKSIVIENMVLPFKFATSVVQFNCTCEDLITGKPFRTAVLSNVNTACKLSFSAGAAPSVSGTEIGQIFKNGDDNIIVNDNGTVVFQMDVPVLEATRGARNLIINQYYPQYGSSHRVNASNNFPEQELNAGNAFIMTCQMRGTPPSGADTGLFTVDNDGKQVFFSHNNLIYLKSEKTWHVSGWDSWAMEAKGDVGENYKNRNDQALFGWGDNTPLRTDTNDENYKWPSEINPSDTSDPWGSKIDDKGTWRTLSIDEWNYLLDWNSPIRKGKYKEGVQIRTSEYGGSVLGTGLVIAPDDFPEEIKNYYTSDEWFDYHNKYGLVFLPLDGRRYGTTVDYVGSSGCYWSSTTKENYTSHAWVMSFSEATVWQWESEPKYTGASVRLVSDVKY